MTEATQTRPESFILELANRLAERDELGPGPEYLIPEHEVEVGDWVRSYDWPDNLPDYYVLEDSRRYGRPYYVEGEVVEIEDHPESPCKCYVIEVHRRVFAGKENGVAGREVAAAPVNGTRSMMGGVTFGVFKIRRPGDEVDEQLMRLKELSERAAEIRHNLVSFRDDNEAEMTGRELELLANAAWHITEGDRALVRLLSIF